VDQYIANNTADASVRVVVPFLLDIEIADVTPQMLASSSILVDDPKRSFQDQLGVSEWDSNWILVEGNYYYMKIFVFDRDKNQILLSDNLLFNNAIDLTHFELVKVNKIKSEFVVRAKKATEKDQKL
jgi:hypothetical protein